MPHLITLMLLLATLATEVAAQTPAPFTAVYDISKGVLKLGTMHRKFELDADGAYHFESRMETRGLVALFHQESVVETSRGRLTAARLMPEHYAYATSRGKRNYALSFDYSKRVVTRADQTAGWSAAMPSDLLDKLAYQVQLMIDLATEPASLDYNIADKGKLKRYLIQNLGHEDIATAAGNFATVKLERDKPDSQRRTTVWCAAALGWLPVKVEYRDDAGAVTTASLSAVQLH